TYFLNFRAQPVGGGAVDPRLWQLGSPGPGGGWKLIEPTQIPSLFIGKNILFATHGFNVTQAAGANSLGLLGKYLDLSGADVFVAMLWPGDSIIPIVDYPFEGDFAIDAGRRLAAFCNNL